MLKSKTKKTILFISFFIFLTACSSSKKNTPQPYTPLNLKGQSASFISGAKDGCDTAYLNYKKDHKAFNNDFQYNKGWWIGRRSCEGREIFYDLEE
jgi:hypothetical protein